MVLNIKSDALKVSDAMKDKIDKVLSKINKRFPLISTNIVISNNLGEFTVSLKCDCQKGGSFQSSATKDTFYLALSDSANKLTRELTTHFDKKKIGVKVQPIEDFQDVIDSDE